MPDENSGWLQAAESNIVEDAGWAIDDCQTFSWHRYRGKVQSSHGSSRPHYGWPPL